MTSPFVDVLASVYATGLSKVLDSENNAAADVLVAVLDTLRVTVLATVLGTALHAVLVTVLDTVVEAALVNVLTTGRVTVPATVLVSGLAKRRVTSVATHAQTHPPKRMAIKTDERLQFRQFGNSRAANQKHQPSQGTGVTSKTKYSTRAGAWNRRVDSNRSPKYMTKGARLPGEPPAKILDVCSATLRIGSVKNYSCKQKCWICSP